MRTVCRYGAWRSARKLAALAIAVAFPTLAVAQQITVAALGDSLTQGYGLPQEDGFVPQLQAWLDENGHEVRVINAGVSGDTTAGGLSRVAWTLGDDVDAVIVALGGNDLLRGLAPEATRENLDGILEAAGAAEVPVLLAGMTAPANYGAAYKDSFDAIYPDLAAAHDALLYPFFLAGLGSADNLAAVQALMQADGVHPNAEGVSRMVADIGPFVVELADRARGG
ncbi:MAG: arylesterase [Pseudomonadota bacterium]